MEPAVQRSELYDALSFVQTEGPVNGAEIIKRFSFSVLGDLMREGFIPRLPRCMLTPKGIETLADLRRERLNVAKTASPAVRPKRRSAWRWRKVLDCVFVSVEQGDGATIRDMLATMQIERDDIVHISTFDAEGNPMVGTASHKIRVAEIWYMLRVGRRRGRRNV